jgi:hypothetical protein
MSDPASPSSTAYTTQTLLDERAPAVMAMRMIHKLITEARATDARLASYADTDLRALNDVQEKLSHNASDQSAVQWLRQLALSWQSKLRNSHPLKFRRIIELVDSARK